MGMNHLAFFSVSRSESALGQHRSECEELSTLTVSSEVLLIRGNELHGNELETGKSQYAANRTCIFEASLPAVLEARDDGANQATLCRVRPVDIRVNPFQDLPGRHRA